MKSFCTLLVSILLFIFSASYCQGQYKVLYSFGTIGPYDGSTPNAGFVSSNGELYGTTAWGGSPCYPSNPGCGTVFAIKQFYNTVTESAIYSFCTTGDPTNCPDGERPSGGLISDQSGNLYGVTGFGGTGVCNDSDVGGCGTVYELTRAGHSWYETVLHSFNGADGWVPVGQLARDSSGNLYGATEAGGAYGFGNVFKLTLEIDGSWTSSTLHDFNPAAGDGAIPLAGIVLDANGNVYGTTVNGGGIGCAGDVGCGTVFQLTPNADGTWTENIILRLNEKGAFPLSELIFDQAGNLYGTANGAGNGDLGGVFRLTPEGGHWRKKAFQFNGVDGEYPYAAVVIWGNALYGTTSDAQQGFGTIFRIQGGRQSVLYTFCSQFNCPDGYPPARGAGLMMRDGKLYGAAVQGGAFKMGVIFEYIP